MSVLLANILSLHKQPESRPNGRLKSTGNAQDVKGSLVMNVTLISLVVSVFINHREIPEDIYTYLYDYFTRQRDE